MKLKQTLNLLATMVIPFALTGCWSSLDIKQTAIAVGTGIAKTDQGYSVSLELLSPSSENGSGASGSKSQKGGKSVVIERSASSIHGATREFIRDMKRRVVYTHNKIWILDENVARDNIVQPLDLLQRDQMFRMRSHLFVTPDDPREVLETNPLFKDVSSVELALGMEEVKFVSDFTTPDLRTFLRDINGPTHSTYLPVVRVERNAKLDTTTIDGTAIIKHEKMVGTLTTSETMGLLWLLGEVKGASISAQTPSGSNVQLEVTKSEAQIQPTLHGGPASANIQIQLLGTLAEIPSNTTLSEAWLRQMEQTISHDIQSQVETTLEKLQKQYHTDVTNVGLGIYRNDPRGWQRVAPLWDNVFTNAHIHVAVETHIYHQGLVNHTTESVTKRPKYVPYLPDSWMHRPQ